MTEPTVLILTGRVDPHVDVVLDRLESRGASALRFHPQHLLHGFTVTASITECGPDEIRFGGPTGRRATASSIRSVYNRGWRTPDPPPDIADPELGRFASEETRFNFRYLLGPLDETYWLTHPDRVRQASAKSRQLRAARAAGLLVPRTLWSNDPGEILAFAEACGGTVLAKPTADVYFEVDGAPHNVWVSPVDLDTLRSSKAQLALTLGCFQEPVPKGVDVRVTVAGSEIFACEVLLENAPDPPVDWRAHPGEYGYRLVDLPDDVAAGVLEVNRRLGVDFGAMDFVRRPDGTYVFLETNVNGQWLWIEQKTGAPIADAVARLLVETGPEPSPCAGEGP